MGRCGPGLLLRLLPAQVLAQRLYLPQALCPAFLNRLRGTRDSQRSGRDILGYYAPGADISAIPDLDRGNQCGIRADEGALSDIGVMLGDTVGRASCRKECRTWWS